MYCQHRFDDRVPVEETVQALDDLVRAGKVRYRGASSMGAWQFAKLQHTARPNGWTTFTAMEHAVAALDLQLSDEETTTPERDYSPQDDYRW